MLEINAELAEFVAKNFEATAEVQEVVRTHIERVKSSELDQAIFNAILVMMHRKDQNFQILAEQNMEIYDRLEKFVDLANSSTRENPSV